MFVYTLLHVFLKHLGTLMYDNPHIHNNRNKVIVIHIILKVSECY